MMSYYAISYQTHWIILFHHIIYYKTVSYYIILSYIKVQYVILDYIIIYYCRYIHVYLYTYYIYVCVFRCFKSEARSLRSKYLALGALGVLLPLGVGPRHDITRVYVTQPFLMNLKGISVTRNAMHYSFQSTSKLASKVQWMEM